MPTYAYRCQECDHAFDAFQKITESPLIDCPDCKKNTLARIPSGGIGLAFKGSGFYITDYASDKKPAQPKASQECCPCGTPTSCQANK